jgi:hypothetical protein
MTVMRLSSAWNRLAWHQQSSAETLAAEVILYRTCLYCNHDLGHNEVVELLPIGRRLAFDAAQGRLWVVCRSCEKWNLVPFDTRLEAIDVCEALFRDARLRYSTDHIGIARLSEGLELVRIGSAQRPEFAAWRYGARFASRRQRNAIVAGGAGLAILGGVAGLHVLIGGALGAQLISPTLRQIQAHRVVTRFVPYGESEPLTLTIRDIRTARVSFVGRVPGNWALNLRARRGVTRRWFLRAPTDGSLEVSGDGLAHALAHLLPGISGLAGSRRQVTSATSLIEADHTLAGQLNGAVISSRPLSKIPAERRLALEMVANEDSERRYLEGELKLLERQWKAADELARIADDLAVTEDVVRELGERKV